MKDPSSALLGAPVIAAAPVSPVARRAPGHGAWGHDPLTGAQVRLLAVTEAQVAVLTLDYDATGPTLYRPLQVEIAVGREEVRGVRLGLLRPSRRFDVVLTGGRTWTLEVSTWGRRLWGPVMSTLGEHRAEAGSEAPVVQPDGRA